jgi:hypothetical protein
LATREALALSYTKWVEIVNARWADRIAAETVATPLTDSTSALWIIGDYPNR